MKQCILAILALLVFSVTGYAQATAGFGAVSGVVRDASGAVVAGAKVDVTNESKGIKRSVETNESGVFTAPALVPADGYVINVTRAGFNPYNLEAVAIQVGQTVGLNITLEVAGTATSVSVTDTAPIIEQGKTGNSANVNSSQIMNLPINGRRVDSFVLLTPAVVADGLFGLLSFRGIAGGNSFLTDGNDTTNQYYNENAGRTRIATQISQDAVQEFQVLSSGYSAEFGRASGGVINTVTRSGGNDVHGTGYWFYRNQDFGARDRYATYTVSPEETRNQYGGSVGGPIRKDKLFYFFNAELIRRNFPLDASIASGNLFNSAGQFVGACNAPATSAQCSAALKFITDRHFQVVPRKADTDLGFGKIDWRPVDRHSFSFSFNYMKWISPNGIQSAATLNNGRGVGENGISTVRTRYGRASWTSIPTSSMVNEVRYGWFKDRLFDDLNPEYIPSTGRVTITVQNQAALGVANYMPRLNPSENRHQIADNLTWTVGKHTLKFGGDMMHTRDYYDQLFNGRGSYVYANFTNFALDFSGNTANGKTWQTFSQAFGNPVVDTYTRDYAWYIQDQLRVNKNLTLNVGLRHEYSQFKQPTTSNPAYPLTAAIRQPGKNFAPRIGLAWAFNDNKTVIRTGYGIFYARFPGSMINTFHQTNGLYSRNVTLNGATPADLALGPIFPSPLPSLDRTPPPGTVDITFAARDFRNPYTQQADFGIQRALTQNLSLDLSYIWSRGARLFTFRDLNIGPLGPDVTYRILDLTGAQVGSYTTPTYRIANRVDPAWRRVNQIDNGGNSYYNAMVVQLNQRAIKGHQFSVSYTWAHAIDYNQGGGSDNLFFNTNGPRSLFNGNFKGDKSSSSLDQRHRLVVSSQHQPRFVDSDRKLARYLINNWQVGQISTFASAQPLTPTIFTSGSPYTGAPITTSINGFGGSNRVPFLPAASLDVDRIIRTDARITKILPFSERYRLMINFEAFNLFNHISNTAIEGQAYTATSANGGTLTPFARFKVPTASGGFPDGTNARRTQVSVRFTF
ncbi:MAG: TonB-dependent receptor domain-containing protein [Bryobacteraceae bacterium]